MRRRVAAVVVSCVVAAGGIVVAQAPVAFAVAPSALPSDPGLPGPLPVSSAVYDLGDTAFNPPGFPGSVEVRGVVFYPTALAKKYPLVVFMHGRHATCYAGSSAYLEWPCSGGAVEIPSYRGYDYIAQVLASDGYIVVSVGANGINAVDQSTSDLGMNARGALIEKHLDLWNTWSTTGGGPFGGQFVGKVNMKKIGTMGHSRGGEGVVRNFLINKARTTPYGIKAVLPLAPVDFSRPVINKVPLGVVLPYCDGDVSDLQGVHFYDDARYNVPTDKKAKNTMLVEGANHNYFNTVWTPGIGPAGASDDAQFGTGSAICQSGAPGRLTAAQQRAVGVAYVVGFFRMYLGNDNAMLPIFTAAVGVPASASPAKVYVSYHAPSTATQRRDINRFDDATNLTTNTLGGSVTTANLAVYDLCGGPSPDPQRCLGSEPDSRQPHTTPSYLASSKRGLRQLRVAWNGSGAAITNNLPVGSRDIHGFAALTMRVTLNYADSRNLLGQAGDFHLVLEDGTATKATVAASSYATVLRYPPGNQVSGSTTPKIVLNTLRIALTAFTGVDMTDIRKVSLVFDVKLSGALLISDLALTQPVPPVLTSSGLSG